jgi:segregation and condensation protein B
MNERAIVEAALYSSGKALTLDELMRVTGFDEAAVKVHLRALAREYTKRGSAIEVTQIGTRWTMQIRVEYTDRARVFAPPEIDRDLLKTAALIAYHQPILQSDLFDMIGEKVYEHTKALEDLRLITRRPSGRSFELTTTRYFAEFFGLKTTNREGIRKIMADRAGISYKEKSAEIGEATTEVTEPAIPSPDAVPPEPAAETAAVPETPEQA